MGSTSRANKFIMSAQSKRFGELFDGHKLHSIYMLYCVFFSVCLPWSWYVADNLGFWYYEKCFVRMCNLAIQVARSHCCRHENSERRVAKEMKSYGDGREWMKFTHHMTIPYPQIILSLSIARPNTSHGFCLLTNESSYVRKDCVKLSSDQIKPKRKGQLLPLTIYHIAFVGCSFASEFTVCADKPTISPTEKP